MRADGANGKIAIGGNAAMSDRHEEWRCVSAGMWLTIEERGGKNVREGGGVQLTLASEREAPPVCSSTTVPW